MPRLCLGWAALGAVALAACTDTQSPDESASTPSAPSGTSLPVMESIELTTPLANAVAGFQIDLRFVNAPTPAQEQFFRAAAARWESIITGDVPDADGLIPARSCGNSFRTPSLQGPFDDLVIHVLLQPIDGPGAVLGAAGACLVRNEDLLPLYGLMFFDTDDLATIEQAGVLDEVIVHEMGHVLGIGTIWERKELLLGAGGDNPTFMGTNAVREYGALRGGDAVPVPVENMGNAGTRDVHWREFIFLTELMTGRIAGPNNPISRMTVASLQDLGYVVDMNAAEPYALPNLFALAEEGLLTPHNAPIDHGIVLPTIPTVLRESSLR